MRARQVLGTVSSALLLAGGIAFVAAPASQAVPTPSTRFVATDGNDTDNTCTDAANPCETIQHAVDVSGAGDTVQIRAGTYDENVRVGISLTLQGQGTSGANLTTIDGGGAPNTASITIDGTDTETPPEVTVENLDVSNNGDGDGIEVISASVHVLDSVVSNNSGDGIDLQDPLSASLAGTTVSANRDNGLLVEPLERELAQVETAPTVTVTSSSLSDNGIDGIDASTGALAISASAVSGNSGAGLYLNGLTGTIATTTIDANHGFGLGLDGGANVTLSDSTVSDTAPADVDGPGFATVGTGVIAYDSDLTMATSTIAGNTGYGLYDYDSVVTVANSTLSATQAAPADFGLATPGALVLATGEQPQAVTRSATQWRAARQIRPMQVAAPTLTATVVAQNQVPDCAGTVTDGGYNLDSDGSCGFTAAQHSISKGNAKLGGLADNGGPTKTLLPAKGSDAIDVIPSGTDNCSAKNTDQRGLSRLAGPKCDIGAVEVAQPPVVIKPGSPLPQGTVGQHYSVTITASGGLGAPYEFSFASGSSAPPGLTLTAGGVLSGTPSQAGTFTFTVSVDDPTLKTYTLVIVAPACDAQLACTGEPVTQTAALGIGLLGVGLLFVVAGAYRRRPGRHSA